MSSEDETSRSGTLMKGEIPLKKPRGINYVFAIGIDDYHHCPRLSNAVRDVNALLVILTRRYQFEPKHVFKFLDQKATTRNIFKKFDELIEKIEPVDRLVIYFSGHGAYKASIEEGYWIPVDGKIEEEETHIPNSAIVKRIRAIKSLHTLLIVDSCFAGSLIHDRNVRSVTEKLETTPSRYLLTSGRTELVSDGLAGKGSPFARSLIYHLNQNRQGVLAVDEIFHFIREDVGSNTSQIPRYEPMRNVGHMGGLFAFRLKHATTPPELAQLAPLDPIPAPFPWKTAAVILLLLALSATTIVWATVIGQKKGSAAINVPLDSFRIDLPTDSTTTIDTTTADRSSVTPKRTFPAKAKLFVSSQRLDFGQIGQAVRQQIQLKNEGGDPLLIQELQADSPNIRLHEPIPFWLKGGDSMMLHVELIPDRLPSGYYDSQLNIRTDPPDQSKTVRLTGVIIAFMDSIYTQIGLAGVRVEFVYEGIPYHDVSDSTGWVKIHFPKRIKLEDPVQTCRFSKGNEEDNWPCNLTHNRITVPPDFKTRLQNLDK